ncbi:MAG: hypothetical protein M9948_01865 [Lentimicrobium sp.]|nr:hypothetical protein [Lentimicrobiaceae bacterium]MCO5264619.1 hypothetical protein [Lentimicrobium sp.]
MNLMKCNDAHLLIIDQLRKSRCEELSPALKEHLSSCKSCSTFYTQFAADVSNFSSGYRNTNDAEFYNKLLLRSREKRTEVSAAAKPKVKYLQLTSAVTAAAAAIFAGVWLGGQLLTFASGPSAESIAGNQELSSRTSMLQSFAEDIHLTSSSELFLENYLAENETESMP